MPAIRPLNRSAAASHPAALGHGRGGGFAADERRYEGLLLPDDFGADLGEHRAARSAGPAGRRVRSESPYSGNGRVTSGDMNGSKCDFHVQTGAGPISTCRHLHGDHLRRQVPPGRAQRRGLAGQLPAGQQAGQDADDHPVGCRPQNRRAGTR
jgi:hypothetical protein